MSKYIANGERAFIKTTSGSAPELGDMGKEFCVEKTADMPLVATHEIFPLTQPLGMSYQWWFSRECARVLECCDDIEFVIFENDVGHLSAFGRSDQKLIPDSPANPKNGWPR